MNEAEELARFYSIEELLDYAFRGEVMKISPDSIHADEQKDFNSLTPQEIIADCSMIKNRAMRNIGNEMEWHTVCAQYRRAVDKDLQDKEAYTLFVLASNLHKECVAKNHLFLADTVRDWSPYMRPYKDLKGWSEKMQVPYSTVRRWATSKQPRHKSVKYFLDTWLESAHVRLSQVFSADGLL